MSLLLEIIGAAVGAVLSRIGARSAATRRSGRYADRGEVEAALRVLTGSEPGLRRRWSHALIQVRPAQRDVHLRVWQFRVRNGKSLRLNVSSASNHETRKVRKWEWWSLEPSLVIGEVTTSTAVLEWAVPEDRLEWMFNTLGR